MGIYVQIFRLPYFLFFWFPVMILSDTLILLMSQLQTQQLMASHTEYLIQTYNILVLM